MENSGWKSSAMRRLSTVRTGMNGQLRSNPTKWAGIAGGAGLLLGIGGRILRSRHNHTHRDDGILIIESAC
jgi:hypothetical protein